MNIIETAALVTATAAAVKKARKAGLTVAEINAVFDAIKTKLEKEDDK